MARPPDYSPELAQSICEHISNGKGTREIETLDGMPSKATIYKWLSKYPEFLDLYARSKMVMAFAWEEDMVEIADDGTNDWMARQRETKGVHYVENAEAINRSRLRVDTRKWLLSKLLPKKYGDKIDHNVSGGVTVTVSSTDAEL